MKKVVKFFKKTVPGLITGGADNDPAGISTYSVAGATTGYSLLWLMVLATPMLIAVQAMCARLGDVKRKGLATILKEHFPAPLAYLAVLILVVCNIFTIGADLSGMAAATSLIIKVNYLFWIIPFALMIWYFVVFENYKIIRNYLLFLVFVFSSYIVSGILARPDWVEIFKKIIFPPIEFVPVYFLAAVGILGTTITPYLFFWQTKEEVEENPTVEAGLKKAPKEEEFLAPGFIFSNIISIFIMISTGAVLFGKKEILTAADAALALRPFTGDLASLTFAIGIIGAGLLAVPVLAASTAYAVSELFYWRESLSAKLSKARGFYFVITFAILVGILIALSPVNPIKALFYSQVLAGILAPIILILILILTNDSKIMGKYTNGWFDNLFGGGAIIVMILSSLILFWQFFK